MKNSRRYITALLAMVLAVGLAGCTKEARKNRRLARADKDFAAGDYDRAEIEYRSARQLVPLDPTAIRQLGIIYFDEGRTLEAFGYLRKAAELEPDNMDVQLKLGTTYLNFRRMTNAVEAALKVLAKRPGDEQALLLLTDAATTPEGNKKILEYLQNARQQDKERAGYHLATGMIYLRKGDVAKAESEWKKALILEPKSSAAHFAMANLYVSQKQLEKAGEEFKTASELAPPRSSARMAYADFKVKTGAVEDGKKMLQEITQATPDYIPAWVALMKLAFMERKFDECKALVEKILARDEANYDGLLQTGLLAMATKEPAKAVTAFERMNSLHLRTPQVCLELARAYLMNNDKPKALASLDTALHMDPHFSEAILMTADLNIRDGKATTAITSLKALLHEQPKIAPAYLLLAQAYMAVPSPDEALRVYQNLMMLAPNNPQIPVMKGALEVQIGQTSEARKSFNKALELAPGYLPAVEQLVNLDIASRQYTQATDLIQKLLKDKPNSPELLIFQARLDMAQKHTDQAEATLLKAVALDPSQQMGYLLLSQLYIESNQQQKALDRLNALLTRTNDVSALMQAGMLEMSLKDYDKARAAYEKLLGFAPKFCPALNNLAWLYSSHFGQVEKAEKLAQQAEDLAPEDPSVGDTLGWIFYKEGKYSRALGLLKESARKQPHDPEFAFHVGMTEYMMGDEGAARSELEQALTGKKDFEGKEEASQRLAILAIDPKTADAAATAELEKRASQETNDIMAQTRLAEIQMRDGAYEKAANSFEAILKQNPQNIPVIFQLARLYAGKLKQPDKALELAKSAHKLAPDDPRVNETLGRLVYESGDFKWTCSLLEDASRLLPNQPELEHNLAWSYYSMGRVPEAEVTMQTAVESGGSFPDAADGKRFVAMVGASHGAAEAKAAAAQAQQLLTATPNYVPALMVLGLTQETASQYKEAQQDYEKALAIFPNFSPAMRRLAFIDSYLGEDQKAYDLAVKARESFPDDADLAKTLGILNYRRGTYDRAAQLLHETVRQHESDGEAFYYEGMAEYKLKQKTESKQALQKALTLNVSSKFADEARRVLAELK